MDDGLEVLGKHALKTRARRQWLTQCSLLAFGVTTGVTMAGQARADQVPTPSSKTTAPVILVVGDSLSAEYGLARGSGWVALLEARLKQAQVDAIVINASISGDTTSGGVTRLPTLLAKYKPAIVVIELGGNDALRGLPLAGTRDNIEAMTKASKAVGAKVVIAGMQLPPNYGRQYGDEFAGVFAEVARRQNVALVPFLLKGVADVPNAAELFQPDRIHPTAAAHPTILDNVWPVLRPLLR